MKNFTKTLIFLFVIVAMTNESKGQTVSNQFYNVTSGNGNGMRFWSSDNYKVHMGNSSYYKYGPVQDYSIKMNMNNDSDRGWTWGVLNTAPTAALSTQGTFQLAKDLRVLGNTGLGTTSPNSKLHVNASSDQVGLRVQISGSSKFTVASNGGTAIGAYNNAPPANGLYVNGKVAIGTTADKSAKLYVAGKTDMIGSENGQLVGILNNQADLASSADLIWGAYGWATSQPNNPRLLHLTKTGVSKFVVRNNGQVGINCDPGNSSYMLTVNGNIKSEKIVVVNNAAPDYVFEDDYVLRSLDEVEEFILNNKHLPEIPSAKEFQEENCDLVEMNNMLLKKIEELTLYVIDLKKENTEIIERLNNQ